ncbi:MAG: hypothetical protein GPI99_00180 [Microcystis aeruginosa W13-15]|jgi:hypothetical protein|nr:hypothetical protein [Microcystis aeruginosa WS75]NCQ67725.1 hypothetical protein [Microcystis aeruginosa W13-16]NCQ72208.1 hypothetical protein [Microcystis aeruginosa W13-13]NCQ76665.1 hypothetical protein [Microcystis aeruginosa W13-15]NCR87800.1 hypothetical protein [Microcystis aeruginosa G13-10]NCS05218.1 hypothetical protein [Microcystis aeruginosa G13-07]NCS32917.1 hypothetical protein [Microcystis aeruginosa G11-01]NCS37768.1 hypothetical protein [Microcystis aeruginosa BS13-10]
MPEPITMFLAFAFGAAVGGAAVYLAEDIKRWAENALRSIIRKVDSNYYVRRSVYYLVKQGSRYFTKIAIAARNLQSGVEKYYEQTDREVDFDKFDENVKNALRGNHEVILMSSNR